MVEAMLCVSVSELKARWDLRILLRSLGLGLIVHLLPVFCLLQKDTVHNLSALKKPQNTPSPPPKCLGKKKKRGRGLFFQVLQNVHSTAP